MNNKFEREFRQMCLNYVKLLLEARYSCEVKGDGTSIDVWSPKGYDKYTIEVDCESDSSQTVAILLARMINGRRVPVITDYHIIVFNGIEGVYSLEEKTLQQLLLDNEVPKVTSEDGTGTYCLFDKQLLLDNCSFYKAAGKKN